MEPVFDKDSRWVASFHVGSGMILNRDMYYVALVHDNGIFSPKKHRFLGYFIDGVFRDARKRPVAFLEGADPSMAMPTIFQPRSPNREPTMLKMHSVPPTPVRPPRPHGHFSPYGWQDLIDENLLFDVDGVSTLRV